MIVCMVCVSQQAKGQLMGHIYRYRSFNLFLTKVTTTLRLLAFRLFICKFKEIIFFRNIPVFTLQQTRVVFFSKLIMSDSL